MIRALQQDEKPRPTLCRHTPVLEELHPADDRRYVRRDQRTSKLVYRSQLIRDRFGTGVAHLFMHLMRVDAAVAQRVLRSPPTKLRR